MACLTALSVCPEAASATAISSKELINEPSKYDLKDVVFEGEAIGDIMQRKGGQWLNVLDNDIAIGIWSTKNIKDQVKRTGDYNNIGDRVVISGIFNQHCEEHGGDLDIHADEVAVVKSGRSVEHPVNAKRLQAAALLTIGAMLAFGFNLSRSKRYL